MLGTRCRTVVLAGLGLFLPIAPAIAVGAGGVDSSAAGYIVVLREGLPSDTPETVARRVVDEARRGIPSLRFKRRAAREVVFRHALQGFAVRIDATDVDKLQQLRNHADVAFVAEDRPIELHGEHFQPGMERIRVGDNAMMAAGNTGLDVDIAVLDTGIDPTHPDLNVFRSVSFLAADDTPSDPHGHGTHVAGIAAAYDDGNGVFGVAPGARLWSIKVVGPSMVGETSDLVAGLDYVKQHAGEIDVANLSLGGLALGDDGNCGFTIGDPLHQAICSVVDSGVVVVASAGNFPPYGRDASLVSPAAYDEVLTVSAVVETDGLGPGAGQGDFTMYGPDNSFAGTFSNYGWDVDIAAPGVEVISTWPGGGYSTWTGTSMAAPHVAGAVAVWIARYGKPTNRADVLHVRDELVRLGFPQLGPDEGFSGDKETYAEPLLNVAAIDPLVFDPVEPRLTPDKPVYDYQQDVEAVVTVELKNEQGSPLEGLPSNGFLVYLAGRQRQVAFDALGQGAYTLTLSIEDLLPGDHDLMALIRNVSGFERSAGCRIVVRESEPRVALRELAFLWPLMNHDSFSSYNPLRAVVTDERGAPLVVPTEAFETTFSGGGPALTWATPAPDYVSGVFAGITYGVYQSQVPDIHSLPLGVYHADVTIAHEGLSDSGTASFAMAYPEPMLSAQLTSNLATFDFTQSIPPPALDLIVEVDNEWSTGVSALQYVVEEPFALKIDGDPVPGVEFTENLLNPGIYTAQDVTIDGLTHGSHEIVVHVVDSRGLEVDSNPVTIDVLRETGPCANPAAGGGQADTDGDGIRDECDNCPTVSNRSQRNSGSDDPAEAGLGDACKSLASLRVSSSTSDNPDFFTIQQAVDAADAGALSVRIDIFPGTGVYTESVIVDRGQSFAFVGNDDGSAVAVVGIGGSGSVFDIRSAGEDPVVIHNLVLRGQGSGAGQSGISVDSSGATILSDLRFEQLGVGIELHNGTHAAEKLTMDSTVATGIVVHDAQLSLKYGEFRGLSEALRILGSAASAELEHLLVAGDGTGTGITNDSTLPGALDLRHSTLVDSRIAVSGSSGNTRISHSVLWDNQSDLSGVSCADVTWSNVQDPDCGATNLSVDPSFVNPAEGDYRLGAASPLLEHGPDPALYSGAPCTDLSGGARLRDHDGDGLARVDPGAYERQSDSGAPPPVADLVWTGATTLEWQAEATAVKYHVYRSLLSTLSYSAFGECADGLDTLLTDTTLTDTTVPPEGDGFYYEVTAENELREESTLGIGTCAERSNFTGCP